MIPHNQNRWHQRVDAGPYERIVILDLLRRLGYGLNDLLWDAGLRFIQIPALSTYSSMRPRECMVDAAMLAEIDERKTVQAAFSPSTFRVYFRVGSPLILGHELGHAVDKGLDQFGSTALETRDAPKRSNLVSNYAFRGDSRERFAESFAAYLNADPPRYSIDHLRRTDRSAAAAIHLIFRGANGSEDARSRLLASPSNLPPILT